MVHPDDSVMIVIFVEFYFVLRENSVSSSAFARLPRVYASIHFSLFFPIFQNIHLHNKYGSRDKKRQKMREKTRRLTISSISFILSLDILDVDHHKCMGDFFPGASEINSKLYFSGFFTIFPVKPFKIAVFDSFLPEKSLQ